MSTEANAKIFSVIGGCRRSGRWLVPGSTNMLTLFGRAFIDLREARTSAEELEFTCLSVFAIVTIIVPEGAEVRPSGTAILGSSRSTVPVSDAACQLPPISVDATTVFGRMRIRTTDTDPEADERKQSKRGWFRRRTRDTVATSEATTEAAAVETASVGNGSGVDLGPVDRRDGVEPLAGATPRHTQVAAGSSAPTGPRPSRPVLDDDDVIGSAAPAVSVPVDLSAPIPAFEDDDVSPIHDVDVPDSLEGTAAAEPGSATPVVADDPDDDADADGDAVIGASAPDGGATADATEPAAAGVGVDDTATADVVG